MPKSFYLARACASVFAAVLTGVAITPVAATTTDPVAPVSIATDAARDKVSTPDRTSDTTRYCVVDTVTGSRIPQKICKTRSEWLKTGFDPLSAK